MLISKNGFRVSYVKKMKIKNIEKIFKYKMKTIYLTKKRVIALVLIANNEMRQKENNLSHKRR